MATQSPYPDTLANETNLPDVVQFVDTYDAEHMNMVRAFIRDMTAEIGVNPSGNKTTLVERLAVSLDNDGKLIWPEQIVTVASSGGHFNTIQSAIDSISDAAVNKPYTVLIYPGLYTETVTLKDHVNLAGFDKHNTQLLNSSFMGVAVTMPADAHNKISNMTLNTTGPMSKSILMNGATLDVMNCHLTGVNRCMNVEAGTTNIFGCTFSGDQGAISNSADNVICNIYNSCFTMGSHLFVFQGDAQVNIYNCHGMGSMIQVNTGSCGIRNCSFVTTSFTVTLNTAAMRITNSHLQAGGDNPALKLMAQSANIVVSNSVLLKSGSAAESVYAYYENTPCSIALCSMNAGLHANCVNQIADPCNVLDANLN